MNLPIEQIICGAVVVGSRVSGLILFAPFFASMAVPMRVKAALTLAITVLLYPLVGRTQLPVLTSAELVRLIAGELLVGAVLGIAVNLVLDGAQLAGQILGVQMGFSLVNIIDPQTQVDTPVLSIFHQTITVLIFLQMNVHHWVLRGLSASFEYLPAGHVTVTWAFTSALWHSVSGLWVAGVQIAAPGLLATMLADIVLGFLSKASPQFPILFVGLSVKSMLGLLVTASAIVFWPRYFEAYFSSAVTMSERLLRLAS